MANVSAEMHLGVRKNDKLTDVGAEVHLGRWGRDLESNDGAANKKC